MGTKLIWKYREKSIVNCWYVVANNKILIIGVVCGTFSEW